MTAGVLHREQTTPAVPKDRHRFQPEMAPHEVQILHLRLDTDVVGPDTAGGSPATALVVVDEPEPFGQMIEFGQQVVITEVRSTVQHDDRWALADLADLQSCVAAAMNSVRAATSESSPASDPTRPLTATLRVAPTIDLGATGSPEPSNSDIKRCPSPSEQVPTRAVGHDARTGVQNGMKRSSFVRSCTAPHWAIRDAAAAALLPLTSTPLVDVLLRP
jgi:hypothetical protein